MKFATYFDRESYNKSEPTRFLKPSLTDQSFKSMCEIEALLLNYRANPRTPVYDLDNYETGRFTFEDWQNQKAIVERKFMHLTEEAKQFFHNDPAEFFKYCTNPANWDKIKEEVQGEKVSEPVVAVSEVSSTQGQSETQAG